VLCFALDYPVVDLWADFESEGGGDLSRTTFPGAMEYSDGSVAADSAVVADRRVTVRDDSEWYR